MPALATVVACPGLCVLARTRLGTYRQVLAQRCDDHSLYSLEPRRVCNEPSQRRNVEQSRFGPMVDAVSSTPGL